MYLKRIELFGFKSFADRTELEFVPGVTAVVGPNGSGKSNIADSVRWVLGEQSVKSLRGAKMEDVIFSGSETRKPLNFSEVSLTLDNSDAILPLDYSEVTVTRRVYRSGESEFLINKQSCRLRDITELFMDTGLGREAYSIIGQGRIEEILSTKAEDRRGILEDAAGIVKYKSRKKEAVRKLEETEANLVRIEDIMSEIEAQLQSLEKQAEKAKEYKQLSAELTRKEVATYVYLLETLHEEWQQLTRKIEEWHEELAQLSFQVNEQDVQVEKWKWNISQAEEKLEAWQQTLLNVTEELEKLEGQRGVLLERKRNYSTNKAETEEKLSALSLRKQHISEELGVVLTKQAQLKETVARTQELLAKELQQINDLSPNLEQRIEEVKADYIELLNKQAALKNELRFLEQSILQESQKLNKLEAETELALRDRNQLENELHVQHNLLKEIAKKLEEKRAAYQETLSRKETMLQALKELEKTWHNDRQQLDKLSNRRKILQEMKDDFAGFFQGVKEILKARKTTLKGIHGAVAELIRVPKEYQVAIETALGASLQYIVVQNEAVGREAIQFLKQRKLGRATFLPLDVIKAKPLNDSIQNMLAQESDVVGTAAKLVHFKEEYKAIIGNLLGQVIVTKDLITANRLAKQLNYRYRFVTLDGDLVNPGGSMTGGSVRPQSTNLLARESELDSLAQEIAKGEHALISLSQEMSKKKLEIDQLEQGLNGLLIEENRLKEQEMIEKERLSQLQYEKQRIDERIEAHKQESLVYSNQQSEAKQKRISCEQELTSIGEQIKELEELIRQLEQQKEETEVSKAEKNEQITQLKVTLARQVQELEEIERSISRIEDAQREIEREWQETNEYFHQLAANLADQDTYERELERAIESKKREKEELSGLIQTAREERRLEQEKVEELELSLRNLRLEQKQLENNIHKEEVKANRLDVELENYLTLLREEYELSYELAKEKYPLTAPYEQVKIEVNELRAAIQALGEVNLGSIEEFERLRERYQFFIEQKSDLQEAKAALYEMIREMDQVMTERFKETYEAVRVQFHQVFAELFGGGRADMILTDPDDLLTTGIDIIAQPPGKKLQHLGLLSGGERALTAIAILFAILKVKPVPFCMLDEVEAALDEANVHRFAHFLKEFSNETQFIVITHRKGTMEGADMLYGITMEESGVSKLVSVKLEEKDTFISA